LNWFKKIARSFSSDFLFVDKEDIWQHSSLEGKLLELFKTEYVVAELKRRQQLTPELQFNKRTKYWISKLTNRIWRTVNEVASEILQHLNYWLEFHTGSSFAERIMEGEFGESYITEEGIVVLGGGFSFDLKDHVIELFLRQNPWFVEQWWAEEEEMNAEEDPEYRQDFSTWTDEDKLQNVKESLLEIADSWSEIERTLGPGLDDAVKDVIRNKVYPAWREHWMNRQSQNQMYTIEEAEENVYSARNRLAKAIEKQNLNELLVSINLALQAEHVHGSMSEHMEVSNQILDKLSNLDTRELDDFVNKITGAYHWASLDSWFKKIAQMFDEKEIDENLPDEQFVEEESLPVVTPQNIYDYLEPEEGQEEESAQPEELKTPPEPVPEEEFTLDTRSQLEDAISSNQCVSMRYTTRKGIDVGTRIIEPYAIFFAHTTGNEILVSWDRTIGAIRAWIISDFNIQPGSVRVFPGDFYHFEKDKFIFKP